MTVRMLTGREHTAMLDCRDTVLRALRAEAKFRTDRDVDVWIAAERRAVADAANRWAERRRVEQRVTVEDVERIECRAVGHVDYAPKLALYVSEVIVGAAPVPRRHGLASDQRT